MTNKNDANLTNFVVKSITQGVLKITPSFRYLFCKSWRFLSILTTRWAQIWDLTSIALLTNYFFECFSPDVRPKWNLILKISVSRVDFWSPKTIRSFLVSRQVIRILFISRYNIQFGVYDETFDEEIFITEKMRCKCEVNQFMIVFIFFLFVGVFIKKCIEEKVGSRLSASNDRICRMSRAQDCSMNFGGYFFLYFDEIDYLLGNWVE